MPIAAVKNPGHSIDHTTKTDQTDLRSRFTGRLKYLDKNQMLQQIRAVLHQENSADLNRIQRVVQDSLNRNQLPMLHLLCHEIMSSTSPQQRLNMFHCLLTLNTLNHKYRQLSLLAQAALETPHFIPQDYWQFSTVFQVLASAIKHGHIHQENACHMDALIQKMTDQNHTQIQYEALKLFNSMIIANIHPSLDTYDALISRVPAPTQQQLNHLKSRHPKMQKEQALQQQLHKTKMLSDMTKPPGMSLEEYGSINEYSLTQFSHILDLIDNVCFSLIDERE